ncbi:MAG: response regulator [Pirellulales bacterium]|nr:response regulator [Pirellulales bacterium]
MTEPLRVALADDEPLIRRWLEETFRDMGHLVVASAANGRELVEACLTLRPTLVVSDIRMPVLDGIEAALAIARDAPAPIILVSAYHDEDLIARATASQVMGYLIKPIERPDLETAVAIACRRFQQLCDAQRAAADLARTLEERKLIERAKGVLMKHAHLDEEQAHRRMQRMASDTNRKLADVARLILAAQEARDLFS